MSNIREDKGYTYGIGAGLLSFRNRSILSISTEVRSEVAELAIEEIIKEIEKLKTEEVAPFELQLVKNYMEGILQRSYDGTFATMDRFKELELAGLNNLHVEKFIKDIKRIDSKRVMEIANRYFDHKSLIILNVGNKS
jgi:predicted Zn-dependent peptidase